MQTTEFYRRVTALALFEHTQSPVSAGFILSRVLKMDLKDSHRDIIPLVKDTIRRYWLVDSQLLELVGEKDWYLLSGDQEKLLDDKFFNTLSPDRASILFDAMEKFKKRQEELA